MRFVLYRDVDTSVEKDTNFLVLDNDADGNTSIVGGGLSAALQFVVYAFNHPFSMLWDASSNMLVCGPTELRDLLRRLRAIYPGFEEVSIQSADEADIRDLMGFGNVSAEALDAVELFFSKN